MKKLLLLTIGVLLCCACAAWAGSLEDGITARDHGDYKKALKRWRSWADQGSQLALYLIGVTYEEGHGVAQDFAQALKCMSLHTTFQGMSVPGIAQSSSEIHDALQAEPEGLDAGFAVGLSRKETAKHGY